jgi:hypothetical protein
LSALERREHVVFAFRASARTERNSSREPSFPLFCSGGQATEVVGRVDNMVSQPIFDSTTAVSIEIPKFDESKLTSHRSILIEPRKGRKKLKKCLKFWYDIF